MRTILTLLAVLVIHLLPADAQDRYRGDYIDEERRLNRKALREHNCFWFGADCPGARHHSYSRWRAKRHRPTYQHHPQEPIQGCLPNVIHVWSGQHNTEDKSKGDAQKRWMIGVQARHGSIYMNFSLGASEKWRCFQSQSHDTFLGKIQSGTSKVLGGEGYFVVCELWKRPCAAPIERSRED